MSWLNKDGNLFTSSRDDGTGKPITDVSDRDVLNWLASNINQSAIETKLDILIDKIETLTTILSNGSTTPPAMLTPSDMILTNGNLYYESPITNTDPDNLYVDSNNNLFFTDATSSINAYLTESNGNVFATF